MKCEDCGATANVRTYDDPETDEPVALCEPCAVQIFGDEPGDLNEADADPDDEFADTCITASDYYRDGDY